MGWLRHDAGLLQSMLVACSAEYDIVVLFCGLATLHSPACLRIVAVLLVVPTSIGFTAQTVVSGTIEGFTFATIWLSLAMHLTI